MFCVQSIKTENRKCSSWMFSLYPAGISPRKGNLRWNERLLSQAVWCEDGSSGLTLVCREIVEARLGWWRPG